MKKVIVIVGPTAVGKTKLSIELAKALKTEIISGDSAQVYQGLDIGTAKVTQSEMEGVPHHLIDIKEPGEDFSVALFQQVVREKIDLISKKNLIPILVGGTGLYLRSVLYDYKFIENERQDDFQLTYESYSNESLHQLLQTVDLESSKAIHMNNRRRVLRALEISLSSDKLKSQLKLNEDDNMMYDACIIGLDLERSLLYERINSRVDEMMELGLIDEAKSLFQRGVTPNIIGYKELIPYLKGEVTLDESIEQIKKDTRNLAKRQLTFFKNKFDVNWFTPNLFDFNQTVDGVMSLLKIWLNQSNDLIIQE